MLSYYARGPKNEQFLDHTSGFQGGWYKQPPLDLAENAIFSLFYLCPGDF